MAGKKAASSVKFLGCSIESFVMYIESKFDIGMNWEAFMRGEIELDHIMPCALFDLTNPEHQRRCFHVSNYQPLWAADNRAKSDSLPVGTMY